MHTLKHVAIGTVPQYVCVYYCPVTYREEDLLDIAPLLAENSRLGNVYIYIPIVCMKGYLDWALLLSYFHCLGIINPQRACAGGLW